MSKIYEALLRAELERTVATGENTTESAAARAVQNLLNPDVQPPSGPDADPLGPVYVESASPSDAALGQMLEPVDFSAIPKRPWAPEAPYLPALQDRGPHVEQFRSLRSHILEARDATPLKSLVVSSGLPGEGKSFVTLNLALSFSRHKTNRVLLIDGDMRRCSLHRLLGTTKEPGLSDFLAGEKSLLEVMQRCDPANRSVPLHPGLSSLSFIPGGRNADNAGDLAAHPRFAELIATAGSWFDWIFVDSSPANLVSDAVSLARACNGVLLVAREGVTKFKTAQLAQTQFKTVPILGFVLNAVPKLPVKGDYYGGYDAYKTEA
ncbi:MAG TPA: CpsD/CapB family tyrosine-protein kinase [Acidobacteriaceae bacterium]|nr:CpsD/CapB family tyrosine-protein kinase [Acidobacteriaceae bacterium]